MKPFKVLLLAAFVCLPGFHHCGAAELRSVGDAQVDLQPLIDWTAKKKGERPLKHWKLVQVLEQKKLSASPELVCDIEGVKTEIILRNCPGALLTLLQQKAALDAKLAAARKDEAAAAQNLGAARNKQQEKLAKRSHKAATDVGKALKKDLADVDQKIKQQQKIYAMATGATYNGLPVWDTGLKSR